MSPLSLHHGLQVCIILASSCISEFTPSQPPRVSPNSHNHGIEVYLEAHSIKTSRFSYFLPPCPSPNSLNYDRPVLTTMASQCICTLAQLRSPSSHDYGLQVYLETCSIMASTSASLSSTQFPPMDTPQKSPMHHLLPEQIYTLCGWVAL